MDTTKLGGRKFILALLVIIFATALVYFTKISDGVYSAIAIAVVSAYIAGNVTQRAQDNAKAAVVEPPKP